MSDNHASSVRVAMVTIARINFDVPLAQSLADRVLARLEYAGLQVSGTRNLLITDAAGAAQAVESLANDQFDLLLVLQATFADSSMVVQLAQPAHESGAPILLWALPEGREGGRLRLNSLCGINLAAHALYLRGIAYEYLLADTDDSADDSAAIDRVALLARASRAKNALNGVRIGVVGDAPAGFDTCHYDAAELETLLGVKVVQIPLATVLEESAVAPDAARAPFLERARQLAPNLDAMDATATRGTAGVHAALTSQINTHELSGVAVRCWPEFFTELGCAACGAMSVLGDSGCPAGCEADVHGTITSLLLQELAGEPAFLADLVSMDAELDSGVLWHCGLAPASMADTLEDSGIRATIHSNRKVPLLFEFALKPGRVTLARLHRTRDAKGALGYALVIGGGEMVRAPRSFGGTSGVVRFDAPAMMVLDRILRNGMEHHVSMIYGDFRDELRIFAQLAGLPILDLTM